MIKSRPYFEDYSTEQTTQTLLKAETRYLDRTSAEYKKFIQQYNLKRDLTISEATAKILLCIEDNELQYVMVDTYTGERPVVMGEHVLQRMGTRCRTSNIARQSDDLAELVRQQMTGAILDKILDSCVCWDNERGRVAADNDDDVTAVAVIQEGKDVIPIYEAGQYVLNIRTVLPKSLGNNYFGPKTRIIFADKDANILSMPPVSYNIGFPQIDNETLKIAYKAA